MSNYAKFWPVASETKPFVHSLDREYETVRPLFDNPWHSKPIFISSDLQIAVVSYKMPLSCLPIYTLHRCGRHVWHRGRPWHAILWVPDHHQLDHRNVIRKCSTLVGTHTLNFNLAVPPSMSIRPPCMGIHRCKTVVIVHLSPLPLCLPLCRLLA